MKRIAFVVVLIALATCWAYVGYTQPRSLRRRRWRGVKWVVGPCCASLCRSDFGGRPTRWLLGGGRTRLQDSALRGRLARQRARWRRPDGHDSNVFTEHARASNELRVRLFGMVLQDPKRQKSAFMLLGQIEQWRLEHGRPTGEPRHPDLTSGQPWPLAWASSSTGTETL